MFMTMPERRALSRLSSTRNSIAQNPAISRKRRLRSKRSWRKSTTKSAYIPRLATVRRWSSSSRCRFRRVAREERPHESNTQCGEQEEQHVPKCDANSRPHRRDGGEKFGFPDGEKLPPGLPVPGWPADFLP